MNPEELNSLKNKLTQAPLNWDYRLALIQAHVVRDQVDEAKQLVRESPDEAGPAPPHVQYRLHRLMTEGRSAAEEFAQEDGQGMAVEAGESKSPANTRIEVEVISTGADESKAPSNTRIEVEVISTGGGTPDGGKGERADLTGGAEDSSGVMADQQEVSTEIKPDIVEEDFASSGVPVGENPMKVVDPSVQQRKLDDSRFIIGSVEEFLPSKPAPDAGRKASALAFAVMAHLILIVILGAIVMAESRPNPPQIVAVNVEENQLLEVPRKRVEQIKRSMLAAASARSTMVITSSAVAPMTLPNFDYSDVSYLPSSMIGFGAGTGFSGEGIGAGTGTRSGMIGGMKIKARRLGVVLDVSGSMDRQIRAVRREIRKNFSTATVVEVVGCSLDWREGDPSFVLKKGKDRIRFKRDADSVVEAVEMLIAALNVDAIFWFSDLMDLQTEAGEQRLSHLLGTQFGSERRPVKFYVQSVDIKPSPALAGIAKRSGGTTKVESFD